MVAVHRLRRAAAVGATLAVLTLASCGGGGSGEGVAVGDGGPNELFAETASFEHVVGVPQRVMVGLSTADGRVLHGGTVALRLTPTGGGPTVRATARFLPVPGSATPPRRAVIGRPSRGLGVYAAEGVTLPSVGFWTVDVRIVTVLGVQHASSAFEVLATGRVPAVGSPAPATRNPVTAGPTVAISAIDSRSGPDGLGDELADPTLHQHVIADLLAAGRPFVVVVSTPTYCQSRFCGPITDLVQQLAADHATAQPGSDLAFVHLEVWGDFAKSKVNPWALEWIAPTGDEGREPWVFVVGRDGRVAARWDDVVDPAQLRDAIERVSRR